jgi:two-component system chemotaxis response regulator CheY
VDDEYVALTKMVAILSHLGLCEAATNGEQAFGMFVKAIDNGRPYQLITIDIQMPGINGIELLKRMKAEEQKTQTAFSRKIIVSAAGSSANVIRAAKYQCDAFLVKPVKRQMLIDKLPEMLLIDKDTYKVYQIKDDAENR